MQRIGTILALAVVFLALVTLLLRHEAGEAFGLANDDFARLAAYSAIGLFIGGGVLLGRGMGLAEALRNLALWLVVGLFLVAGYAYREEAAAIGWRILGVLVPGLPVAEGSGDAARIAVVRSERGGFTLRAEVDGVAIDFLIDSGASTVVLSAGDAARLGAGATGLRYTVPVATANGRGYAAPLSIGEIRVGDIVVKDLPALVARPGALRQSLLGMNFLDRLSGWEVSGDRLILSR